MQIPDAKAGYAMEAEACPPLKPSSFPRNQRQWIPAFAGMTTYVGPIG